MTIELCIDFCTGLNDVDSAYAGVEFANECYCGVASRNYSRLGVAKRSDCDHPCSGDNTTHCGGSNRISIYNLLLIRPQTATETSSTSVIPTSPDASTTLDKRTEESDESTTSTRSTKSALYAGAGGGGAFLLILIIIIIVVVTRRRRLKHGSYQGIAVSERAVESPGMRDNPTFDSSNVHDLRVLDVVDCHGGNDQYIALTTPHGGLTVQVYEPLRESNSQGDGYEVPINGANEQTGPEYDKTLHMLKEHPETDDEIAHEYQDITNDIVGRNNSRNERPVRGLQVKHETDYEITHEYQDLTNSVVGRNNSIGNKSPVRGLQVQPKTDYEAIHEYEDPGIIG